MAGEAGRIGREAVAGRLGAAPSLLTADESAARQQHIADALATLREAKTDSEEKK